MSVQVHMQEDAGRRHMPPYLRVRGLESHNPFTRNGSRPARRSTVSCLLDIFHGTSTKRGCMREGEGAFYFILLLLPLMEVVNANYIVYDRNSFLFNKQKQIYCTQIFTENLFNRKRKNITVTNRYTLIFCLFLLFPWFVSVALSVSFLFYTNQQQKLNR